MTAEDLQGMFSLCCEVGADNLHEYLFSIGAKPTAADFAKAVNADNLIIVKWFVETLYFSVNDHGVGARAGGGVEKYLEARGKQ